MSHTHLAQNVSRTQEATTTSPASRRTIIAIMAVIAVITAAGIFVLWPDWKQLEDVRQWNFNFATAPSVTYERATIVKISSKCQDSTISPTGIPTSLDECVRFEVRVTSGPDSGQITALETVGPGANSGLGVGDTIQVMRAPGVDPGTYTYTFTGIPHDIPILMFAALFVITVLVVARGKGALSLLGLAFATVVILFFMLPALASGRSGIWVGLVGSCAIMLVVLHVAHGVSMRTAAAMLGTTGGLLLSAALSSLAVKTAHLSGYIDETAFDLSASIPNLNMRELFVTAVILAGLGVLNDVTITQASAVWELRIAAPNYTRREIYRSAMRIGRDHIASTIYTIVFAYTGAALTTVMLIVLFFQRSLSDLFTTESLAAEMLQIFASGTALVLSVPLTTAIAVAAVRKEGKGNVPDGPSSTQRS